MIRLGLMSFLISLASFAHSNVELATMMKSMGKNFGQLSRQIADPTLNVSSSELSLTIQALLVLGKTEEPGKTDELPESERAQFLIDYRTDMDAMAVSMKSLRQLLDANKNAEAVELRKAILLKMGEAHQKYRF